MDMIQPYIIEIFSGLAALIISVVSAKINKYVGLKIEQQHRDALHQAIMTAVEGAVAYKHENSLTVPIHDIAKNKVRMYVRQSVPDAVKALVPGDSVLDDLAVKYVNRLMANKT